MSVSASCQLDYSHYKDDDKKKASRYNKHYLRFCCGTHELMIYDKTYQIQNGCAKIAYENLPEGVLRFEVHCGAELLLSKQFKLYGHSHPGEIAPVASPEDREVLRIIGQRTSRLIAALSGVELQFGDDPFEIL